jgi:predicted DCC family thiol-disulfide oxidoreductase YuxK
MTVEHLILYDGDCGLCQYSVQWLLQRDRDQLLYFAPLKGETATLYLQGATLPTDLDSIVYIRGGQSYFYYSSAFVELLKALPAPWSWMRCLGFFPKVLRDLFYKWVARNRLQFFGAAESCKWPTQEESLRFLP